MAPPVNGELGSTATIPTLWPWRRSCAVRRSTSEDLPAPGGPVTPTTNASPACGIERRQQRVGRRAAILDERDRARHRARVAREDAGGERVDVGRDRAQRATGRSCRGLRDPSPSSKCIENMVYRWPRMRRRLAWIALASLALVVLLAAWVLLGLPSRSAVRELATKNPGKTRLMLQREAEAAAKGRKPRTVVTWVPLTLVSRHLIHAVLAAEDQNFFGHEGVDWDAIQKSLEKDVEKRRFARGGSTITQQLAKNLYFGTRKTITRKLRELIVARWLESDLSKARILALYLNVIEWGDGVYGCEAAARRWYGKSAAALSASEAAGPRGDDPEPEASQPPGEPGAPRARHAPRAVADGAMPATSAATRRASALRRRPRSRSRRTRSLRRHGTLATAGRRVGCRGAAFGSDAARLCRLPFAGHGRDASGGTRRPESAGRRPRRPRSLLRRRRDSPHRTGRPPL